MAAFSHALCETELRRFMREITNDLTSSQDQKKILNILSIIRFLANAIPNSNSYVDESEVIENDIAAVISHYGLQMFQERTKVYKLLFYKLYYSKILIIVLNKLSVEILSEFPKDKIRTHIDGLFLYGPASNSFLVLTHTVTESSPGFKMHKCVSLLEDFLHGHRLAEVLKSACSVGSEPVGGPVPDSTDSSRLQWDQLVVAVVSLPDNMANKLKNQNSDVFLPANYIPLVGRDLMHTLQYVHDMISSNSDCSLEFVCRLFGKLCMAGYADILWDAILPSLYRHVQTDYIWCRICMRIITGLPDRGVESAILPLLTKIPWWGAVSKFLGDCVVDSPRVQYVLCTKLLLHRFSQQVLLLQNVIGYLASSHTRRQLYVQVMKKLLQVWGDSSALKHTSYEQHLYVCRALVICISHLREKDTPDVRRELHHLLLPGIQCHIGCADVKIRKQGMVVAEIITKTLDPAGPQLKFEYERDAEVDDLFSLLKVPQEPTTQEIEKRLGSLVVDDATPCELLKPAPEETKMKDTNNSSTTQTSSDLDSDDDMEPYDMTHDVPVTKSKTPKYIRDCLEGLICSDDHDRVEACLKSAENLVRSNSEAVREIAAELCKVLLHLSDNSAIADFLLLRFAAMVAVTVQCPQESAILLTNEFYERNYNLRQRMDMLEVLAAAAQELSSPEKADKVKDAKPVEEITPKSEVSNWRAIVEKRIESNTRRFAKGPRQPPLPETANRFAPVSGYFYYPLMKHFDRKESCLDLLGEDLLILGRLVFTLGIILYAAIHTPNCHRMGTTLLEFTWGFRFHADPYIKQSVLFATSMIFLVVPCHFLWSDLQSEVTETKFWLQDVAEKDANTECKKLAIQALVLLENSFKNEFDKGVSIT